MKTVLFWCRSHLVLLISFLAALLSAIAVPPDSAYLSYINTDVLILLFCLMTAVAGFRRIGLFDRISSMLLHRAGTVRKLGLLLMNLCFFSSMLVTNDVALITFVPLTLMLFSRINDSKSLITSVVIQTVAANLGSMMTPVGNPQNLYIYAQYDLDITVFFTVMLPVGIFSYILLTLLVFLLPASPCKAEPVQTEKPPPVKAAIYAVMFVVSIATVLRLIPGWICLIIVALLALISDVKLFLKVDYALLATFVCFFIFVGNIARIEPVRLFFSAVMQGRELIVSALLSQVISNVPAAVMLSGFTENAKALLLGVDIGGLGTPVASLASLISYQLYSRSKTADNKRYMLVFSAVNFVLLIILLIFAFIIQPLLGF